MESCEGPPPRPTGSGDWVEAQKVPPPFEGGAGPGLRSAGTGPASRGRLGLGGFQAAGPGKPGGCGRTVRPGLAALSDPLRAEHSAQAPPRPPRRPHRYLTLWDARGTRWPRPIPTQLAQGSAPRFPSSCSHISGLPAAPPPPRATFSATPAARSYASAF